MKHAIVCLLICIAVVLLSSLSTAAKAAPGAHGPNGEHLAETRNDALGNIGRQADGSVIMPMNMQATLGIRTTLVSAQTVNQTTELSGVVLPHPRGHAIVQPHNDGRYYAPEGAVPVTGMMVKAGQVLGEMRFSDTAFEQASQISELLAVRNNVAQAQRDVARLKQLGELASEQELERLETRLKTLLEQEQSLSIGLEKPVPLIAPLSGIVINPSTVDGAWVKAGTPLFEIISEKQRHIDGFTSDFALPSQMTSARVLEYPNATLEYHASSPTLESGMLSLHFEVTLADASVMPINQSITVIATTKRQKEGIVAPSEAVVTNSLNLPIVWIKAGAERFIPQVIQYERLSATQVLITNGLGEDNRVVVNSASLLNQVR